LAATAAALVLGNLVGNVVGRGRLLETRQRLEHAARICVHCSPERSIVVCAAVISDSPS
jgi:hypothetical protein